MTSKEYIEVLECINNKLEGLDNITIYRVHSSYDPKNDKICKITLKINYTKDGKPLPDISNGKLPKNVVERSVNFRNDIKKEDIEKWLIDFMIEKNIL